MDEDRGKRILEDWVVESLPDGSTRLAPAGGTWACQPVAHILQLCLVSLCMAFMAVLIAASMVSPKEFPLWAFRGIFPYPLAAGAVAGAVLYGVGDADKEFRLSPDRLVRLRIYFGWFSLAECHTGATLAFRRDMENEKHAWSLVLEDSGNKLDLITTKQAPKRIPIRPNKPRGRFLRRISSLSKVFDKAAPYDLEELAVLTGIIAEKTGWKIRNIDVLHPRPIEDFAEDSEEDTDGC